jgi:hypothetical protein
MQTFAPPGWDWRVPSPDEMSAPDADALSRSHQTWLWDETQAAFVVDVFRDLADGDRWICRRDETIGAAWSDVVARTAGGVPFLVPEVVLLFKAKHARPKDVTDLDNVVPRMSAEARGRLADWLVRVHPGHGWLDRLA